MADQPADNRSTDGAPRRKHSYSRLTTAIAVLALAIAGYALLRLDHARDRLDGLGRQIAQLESGRTLLETELKSQAERELAARNDITRRLDALNDAPKQLQEFGTALEELRGRAEGPERAWSRAEAAFLMEVARQRLLLNRDIDTAITALDAADSRLATLRDPALASVRQQLAQDVQALRSAPRPDLTGVLARLTNAEEQATAVPVLGIVAVERAAGAEALPEGFFARAWAVIRNAFAGLITVRKADSRDSMMVTLEEQTLRRQHLQLLIFSARAAVVRHDASAYHSAMNGAHQWLTEFFNVRDPAGAALVSEIASLEAIDIDPPLPDISASARALARLSPVQHATP